MSEEEKDEPITVSEAMVATYRYVDSAVAKALEKLTISCKKGCNDCCKLLCTCTFAEALLIADTLLRRSDEEWDAWLPKLRAAAQEADFPEVDNDTYFKKKVPCVFLKDGACSIYEIRPAACRLHYVLTPPENCSPDAPTIKIQSPDFRPLEQMIWKVSKQVLDESFGGKMAMMAGPLPLMVMAVALVLLKEDPQHRTEVLVACKGLLTPEKWMVRMILNKEKRLSS